MIQAIESAIIDYLKPKFPAALVQAFPDKLDKYEDVPMNRGLAVLVAYRSTTFGEPKALGLTVQEARATFEITAVAKSRSGHQGVLVLLDGLRLKLTGLRPAGAEPMRPVSEELAPAPNGFWVYTTTWSTSYPHVEDFAEDAQDGYVDGTFVHQTPTDDPDAPLTDTWSVNLDTGAVTDGPIAHP